MKLTEKQIYQRNICSEYDQASKELIKIQQQVSPNLDILESAREDVRQKMLKIREAFNI